MPSLSVEEFGDGTHEVGGGGFGRDATVEDGPIRCPVQPQSQPLGLVGCAGDKSDQALRHVSGLCQPLYAIRIPGSEPIHHDSRTQVQLRPAFQGHAIRLCRRRRDEVDGAKESLLRDWNPVGKGGFGFEYRVSRGVAVTLVPGEYLGQYQGDGSWNHSLTTRGGITFNVYR